MVQNHPTCCSSSGSTTGSRTLAFLILSSSISSNSISFSVFSRSPMVATAEAGTVTYKLWMRSVAAIWEENENYTWSCSKKEESNGPYKCANESNTSNVTIIWTKILKSHHSTRELPDNVLVIKFKNEKMVLSNIPAFPKWCCLGALYILTKKV